jgi:hypothetical protein
MSTFVPSSSRSLPTTMPSLVALLLTFLVGACDTSATNILDRGDGSSDPDKSAPIVASVRVTPDKVDLEIGQEQQLTAKAFDGDGNELPRSPEDYAWSSSNTSVEVSKSGQVTALTVGTATVTASLGGHSGSSLIASSDTDGAEQADEWDNVIADVSVSGDVVVPEGETWLFGANVEVAGNVVVHGTLAMRPGSGLKFIGADPAQYVGGGMTFGPGLERDIGLWVGPTGRLDIAGTPKQGWNRTGTHSTWAPDDEYWIAPTDVGDYEPKRWYPGDPIPQVDPRVPAAEVVNVTRDIVIEGPGHIHIHAHHPQRIEYVRLEKMGIATGSGPVLGRYALHLHHGGDATRGTIIQGVAAVNSGGRVFVPHETHGVTMVDNVSVNSYAAAFWWDEGDNTNDLLVDRLAVLGVNPGDRYDGTARFDGALLGSGLNVEIRNSVIAGVCCNKLSTAFSWISGGKAPDPVWIFERGNLAHNNTGPGARFWTNLKHDHTIFDYISYRNDEGGVQGGAYKNAVRYDDMLMVDDYVFQNASARVGASYTNFQVFNSLGPAFVVGKRNLGSDTHLPVEDCVLEAGAGHPKVYIEDGNNPWLAHFVRCGVTPDDIEFETLTGGNDGTHILIDHEDGRKWEIRIENGQKIVREL